MSPPFAGPLPPRHIPGTGPILLLCDHASNDPQGVDLGIAPDVFARHIAYDIGAAALTEALAAALGAPALLGQVSRLVVDLNRQADHPALVPLVSDGHALPGNQGADRAARIARFHAPYHAAIAAQIAAARPELIIAIHSFTPALETGSAPRPWPIGVLYNRDARAAQAALALLGREGILAGDNQPYSGRLLNATLNRHAEGQGIASLSLELRNDEIADAAGVTQWGALLAPLLRTALAAITPIAL